jgi:anti-sigma factor RsiW
LIHPAPGEWMDFIYAELTPERQHELQGHLATCPACAAQVKSWRATMRSLDRWSVPAVRRGLRRLVQPLRWAAAAAVFLLAGFALGRLNTTSASELAELKTTVTQLSDSLQRDRTLTLSNAVAAAASAANQETLRLVSNYAQLQDDQRAADKRALAVALRNADFRIDKLQSDLETVALNAQADFEQTHQNITRVASLAYDSKQQPK